MRKVLRSRSRFRVDAGHAREEACRLFALSPLCEAAESSMMTLLLSLSRRLKLLSFLEWTPKKMRLVEWKRTSVLAVT